MKLVLRFQREFVGGAKGLFFGDYLQIGGIINSDQQNAEIREKDPV